MSMMAVELCENQDISVDRPTAVEPLLRAMYGTPPRVTDRDRVLQAVQEELYTLDEEGMVGMLSRYVLEEYYLHGVSKKHIVSDLTAYIDLFAEDFLRAGIRSMRRPLHRYRITEAIRGKIE